MGLCGLVGLFLSLFIGMAHAAPSPNVVEAAKREGKLIWWTSGSANDSRALIKKFNERYPFIQVEIWTAAGEDVSEKIWAEHNANRHAWDVSLGADIQLHYAEWVKRGIVEKLPPDGLKQIPARAKDPNGYWAQMGGNVTVPAYNTNFVSPKDAPKSWEDLLNPKWKGKLGLHIDPRMWQVLSQPEGWGKEKVVNYVTRLAQNKPQLIRSNTQNVALLLAGEFPIAVNVFLYRVLQYKVKGAPVEWVRVNPVVISGSAFIKSKKGLNPNAGFLWLDWIFSPEGVKNVDQLTFKGSPFPGSGTTQSEAIKGLNMVVRDGDYYGKTQDFGRQLQKILGVL
ncbi:MAG TPA: extracellular solute-binding protein [Candidatus Limnocylindrales bacterium]|nr:extracellular solute-binding protein [Candidatus Limnocylindrales bacterium]